MSAMAVDQPLVKKIVALGVPVPAAIKAALGCSLTDFANAHGLGGSEVRGCVTGFQHHTRVRVVLASVLGVEREWLDEQLNSVKGLAPLAVRTADESAPEGSVRRPLSLRLSASEHRLISSAAALDKEPPATWMRRALVEVASERVERGR
jgi:hypothetical protein